MRLKFESFDGRSQTHRDVIDEETGKKVGYIWSHGVGTYRSGGIDVSLFDGKYETTVDAYDKCWGFVKGVEKVLNHIVSVKDESATKADNKAA